jgi:hypothetical protein
MGQLFPRSVPAIFVQAFAKQKMSSTQLGLQSYDVPKDWLRVSFVSV